MFAGEKYFFENFRHGAVRNFALEDFLEFGISARDDIADDNKIGGRCEMRSIERGKICNAKTVEECGCWRINSRVGAGDAKTFFAQHSGERSHGGAADSDDVNVLSLYRTLINVSISCVSNMGLSHAMTAGSRISSVPLFSAFRRARMPRGIVSIGRAVWPMGAP